MDGYQADAIPYNYIDQPPKSMEALKRNLEIVRHLIAPTTMSEKSMFRTRLVDPLRHLVYLKIDNFISGAKLILALTLKDNNIALNNNATNSNVSITNLEVNDIAELFKRLENQSNQLSEPVKHQLRELIRDLVYLREMEKLESDLLAKNNGGGGSTTSSAIEQQQRKPSDVVPVTGLILNRLHRLENELKTVLEHWTRQGFAMPGGPTHNNRYGKVTQT